jgi:predicted dehydrogenase
VLACINNWTQAPILARLQGLCRSGALGRLRSLEISVERTQPAKAAAGGDNWRVDRERAGGGILFDHGWHGMSILGRALAARPRKVRCALARRAQSELSVEDTAEVDVDYADGSRGRFTATWTAALRRNRALAAGERGSIELDNDVLCIEVDGERREERFAESLADGGYRPSWTAAIIREFVAEIADPARSRRAAGEALTCMRLLDAAYEADARGGSVEL